jgi:hypothetical protein
VHMAEEVDLGLYHGRVGWDTGMLRSSIDMEYGRALELEYVCRDRECMELSAQSGIDHLILLRLY